MENLITLNEEQKKAYDFILKGKNVLLLGQAGTGKSYVVSKIKKYYDENNINYGITAPTGIAAYNINGKTLNSFLGIGLGKDTAELMYSKVNYGIKKKLKKLEVLIIDEISMLNSELFDKISLYLSLIKNNTLLFGGIQLILIGDFFQLQPITGDFCFTSDLWNDCKFNIIQLTTIIRQQNDPLFQEILLGLRYGICSENTYAILKEQKYDKFKDSVVKPTKLFSRNENVDDINLKEFKKIKSIHNHSIIYNTLFYDEKNQLVPLFDVFSQLNSLSIPESIELSIGCQVIVTFNINIENGLVNGTRGVIIDIQKNFVVIQLVNNQTCEIHPQKIPINLDDKIKGYAVFMPLKLAYALTIHKCQGMTMDAIQIDIGKKIFTYGQAYTAISRAKDLKSVEILDISKSSFKINPTVLEFYKSIQS